VRVSQRLYHARMIPPRPDPPSPPRQLTDPPPDIPPGAQGAPDIQIASARLRDLPAIAALQRRAFPPPLAYTLSTLVVLWALPWVRLLAARRNGQILGVVIGDRVVEGGRVINLAVDPVVQRQGVGTALLHAVERTLPGGDMTLMVQSGNSAARSLYRSVGYEDAAENPNYYGPGRPGVRMRKRRG